ncbi:hypothetical protein SUGI_0571300 [Cryptomeria japonica]|nr:hypothetical protein SUGI_0571300 [Cryptomeria japonica]
MGADARRELEDKCILEYVGNFVTDDLIELFIDEIVDEEELALQKTLLARELCKPDTDDLVNPPFGDVANEKMECLGIANTMENCSPPDFVADLIKWGRKSISELLTQARSAEYGLIQSAMDFISSQVQLKS